MKTMTVMMIRSHYSAPQLLLLLPPLLPPLLSLQLLLWAPFRVKVFHGEKHEEDEGEEQVMMCGDCKQGRMLTPY